MLTLAAVATSTAASASPQAALLLQINAVRAAHGLAPLHVNASLERAATFHSREMLSEDVFTHGAFATRMSRFGVKGALAGENLAWGVGDGATAKAVVAGWLRSPEHRANLLRVRFTRVGLGEDVGTFLGYADATVVTADFAG